MSIDAGGLAQMTYNHSAFNGGLGMSPTGFASRKGTNVKRLSMAPPSKINTIDEDHPAPPRTSRSHLLAGLRTAPRSPAVPSSAPPDQLQFPGGGSNAGRFAKMDDQMSHRGVPKTATTANFPNVQQNPHNLAAGNNFYSPEQVLAPPTIQMNDDLGQMDPAMYEELVRTNQYLAEQQMRLQQQLINVTAAAQQFQNLNFGQAQTGLSPLSPNAATSFYEQQLQCGLQPIIEEVPSQPGLFSVFNPMTKQTSFYRDPNYQAQKQEAAPMTSMGQDMSHSPPPPTLTFRAQASSPAEAPSHSSSSNWRSMTPPKVQSSPPVDEPTPLPQPANFRHRKGLSLINTSAGSSLGDGGPRTGGLRSAGLPPTPMTGTFGPGQNREGEHPVRQPRGPPSLEELTAKPTAKHEGSKNFASRQRRRAVHSLVRAGLERRGAGRGSGGSVGSADSGTPTSERDAPVLAASPVPSDTSARSGSASLSGQPSLGDLRASSVGAIGSERAEMKERSRERGSVDSYTAASVSSEDVSAVGGPLVEIKAEDPAEGPRRAKLLPLATAEKRRSQMF